MTPWETRETLDVYCHACGLLLHELPPTTCKSCGIHHWHDAKPTGVAFVQHEGRLLLVRRALEPWKGRWDFPGGFCEEREHPISAAEREVFEETGIRIRVIGYLGAWHETHHDPDLPPGLSKTTLGFFYHAVPIADVEPNVSHEIMDAAWLLPDDIPGDVAFPEQQLPALAAWRRAVEGGQTTTPLLDRPLS